MRRGAQAKREADSAASDRMEGIEKVELAVICEGMGFPLPGGR